MKTLEQIEPRIDVMTLASNATSEIVISQAGSYYLSGNLDVGKTYGIFIGADHVTLDLNGFAITRTSGSGGYGVYLSGTCLGSTIRNGSASGFLSGIYGINSESVLFEKLEASGCSFAGIYAGLSARLIDCRVSNVAGAGSYGIFCGSESIMTGCLANNCAGFAAIRCGNNALLSGCAAYNNSTTYGIYLVGSGNISDCSSIDNNSVSSASYGIYASGGNSRISGCMVDGNINTNSPSTSSQGCGIYVFNGSIVKDCTVTANRGDGIRVSGDCLVFGNNCDSNGTGDGAGIHAISSDCRIENNTVTDQDRGIDVDGIGNLIVRNSASGNTVNYEIASGNSVGTIISTPASGAISGSTGGTGVGTTDPWANFSF
ncbi:MAG: right-handed parallel beta-helix repeat-containing protein [Kiritimatiellales bacterium]|nr:right-handed parallel beta-helix repeat-containing protein [Kiritimatiellales bacterium]